MQFGKINKRYIVFLFLFFTIINHAEAQEVPVIERARVVEIVRDEDTTILEEIGRSVASFQQTLSVELMDGEDKGKKITLENDYVRFKKGDIILLEKIVTDTEENYVVRERDRQFPILLLFLIFALAILVFGGKQGLRSLLSLTGSFIVIIYFLLPLLIRGYSPVLTSVSLAAAILFIAIFFTHGFNRESVVAFAGTILAVICTGFLALFSVSLMKLTGFNTEETIFLSIGNATRLNFHGLLLGGILIGVLGILDDIAVTQAAVVSEIYKSAGHLKPGEVYAKAMRVGREHVSALVNTLVLAYTGAALPLLLLVSISDYPLRFIVSQELFSTEIVRTIVGSMGLVLTVPITTLLAVYFLRSRPPS